MIKITESGIDELIAWITRIGKEAAHLAAGAVTEYLVGDERHGQRHYPPYVYLGSADEGAYKKVYGGFISDAQRRYVMAMIKEGQITPGISSSNRYFGDAWKIEDKGRYWQAMNDTKHSPYLVGDNNQSKMMAMKGWRKVSQNIADNFKGALIHAQAKLRAWLKEQEKG